MRLVCEIKCKQVFLIINEVKKNVESNKTKKVKQNLKYGQKRGLLLKLINRYQ